MYDFSHICASPLPGNLDKCRQILEKGRTRVADPTPIARAWKRLIGSTKTTETSVCKPLYDW
jgi:hypothetical protein